ncbi:MAG: hypothetical protein ACP5OA_03015 [Candidatus Woesearchaeota archaeon]
MKKLIMTVVLLVFVTAFSYADLIPSLCQIPAEIAMIKGEEIEEGTSFSLEVPPDGGLLEDDNYVMMKNTKTGEYIPGQAPLFPAYFGRIDFDMTDCFWGLEGVLVWDKFPLKIRGCECFYPEKHDTLTLPMLIVKGQHEATMNVSCSSYSKEKKLEFPSNGLSRIVFATTTSFSYKGQAAPIGSLPFDLYLKKQNGEKILICHLNIIFDYSFYISDGEMSWHVNNISYSELNANYSITFSSYYDRLIKIRKLQYPENLTKKFYNCDFFIMFPNVINPFSDIDVRPVGKILENKFHFDSKDITLCNVYASSKSNMFCDNITTPEDLLKAHKNRGFARLAPLVDIPIYNTATSTDTDRKNMEIIDGSILASNEASRNEKMYSWDRCKGTHFQPLDNKECNYKWIQLYAYENMPEIPPRLDYDIINKNNGKTGHIRLYFKIVPGWEGNRWWLDRVEGDYDGKSAQIAGGPGFLGLDGNPWVISFN